MPSPVRIDYIVIGSGIAGLTAALELGKHGYVAVLTKNKISESASVYAQGGIAAALSADDSPELHLQDTLKAGDGLCNEDYVRILTQEGPKRVQDLIDVGTNFDQNNGQLSLSLEAAHSKRRILHSKDCTGRELIRSLTEAIYNSGTISFFSHTSVLKLLLSDNRIVGCLAAWKGIPTLFHAKAVVIATGGYSHIYSRTTNPAVSTGDGIALAFHAGCTLQDMEFVQFHPTTLYMGQQSDQAFLISEAVRGEGATLRNAHNELFMKQYHPDAELAPRDVVSRAIYFECKKTKVNHVYLDTHLLKGDIKERFPTIYQHCLEKGLDITRVPIPVSPAAHYSMGGIKTNEWGQTGIHGLYAIGESASLGLHGANRLASNSLLDGLVFGYRAAQHISNLPDCDITTFESPEIFYNDSNLSNDKIKNITDIAPLLRQNLWNHAGIIRDTHSLETLMDDLKQYQWILNIPTLNQDIIAVQHHLLLSNLVVSAAHKRQESRGSHYRLDFPTRNDADWRIHLTQKG